jgi:hypothetical protein
MTVCPHCRRRFKEVKDYAQHLLEKHKEDEIRVDWANTVLGKNAPEVVEGDAQTEDEGGIMKSNKEGKEAAPDKPKMTREEALTALKALTGEDYSDVGVKKTAAKQTVPKQSETGSEAVAVMKKVFGNLPTIIAIAALLVSLWALLAARTAGIDIQDIQTDVTALQASSTAYGNRIDLLEAHDAQHQGVLTTLQGNYDGLSANYTTLNNNYNSLNSRYTTLQSSFAALSTQVTGLENTPGVIVAHQSATGVNITFQGAGNYTVFASLCGTNITSVTVGSNMTYAIGGSWALNVTGDLNTQYTVSVVPTGLWADADNICLNVTAADVAFVHVWLAER